MYFELGLKHQLQTQTVRKCRESAVLSSARTCRSISEHVKTRQTMTDRLADQQQAANTGVARGALTTDGQCYGNATITKYSPRPDCTIIKTTRVHLGSKLSGNITWSPISLQINSQMFKSEGFENFHCQLENLWLADCFYLLLLRIMLVDLDSGNVLDCLVREIGHFQLLLLLFGVKQLNTLAKILHLVVF